MKDLRFPFRRPALFGTRSLAPGLLLAAGLGLLPLSAHASASDSSAAGPYQPGAYAPDPYPPGSYIPNPYMPGRHRPVIGAWALRYPLGPAAAGAGPAEVSAMDTSTSADSGAHASRPAKPRSFEARLMLARCQRIENTLSKAAGFATPVTVDLLDSGVVNSWTEGHTITVTTGLLRMVSDDDELAAVLGHESGHIKAHHVAKEEKVGILAAVGTVLAGVLVGQKAEIATALGSSLALKKYSRDEEAEADRIGMRLMEQAGYDGRAMALLFDHFSQMAASDPALFSTFLTDHPSDAVRIRRLATYPDLDPNLLANQLKLENGLLDRHEVFSAARLGLRLAQEYPNHPEVQAAAQRALTQLRSAPDSGAPSPSGAASTPGAASMPAVAPILALTSASDLGVVPPAIYDPAAVPLKTTAPEHAALEEAARTGSQFYELVHELEGLETRSAYTSDSTGLQSYNLFTYHLLQNAWNSTLELGENIEPVSAALIGVDRATALMETAARYPAPGAGDTPADAALLAATSRQISEARVALDEARQQAVAASSADARDAHDLASGLARLQEALFGQPSERTAYNSPQMQLAIFGTGEGGVARFEARSALRKAAAAELRLEFAALDWQSRSLDPARKSALLHWARGYLSLPEVPASGAGLGTMLLQELVKAQPSGTLAQAEVNNLNLPPRGTTPIEITGMPAGDRPFVSRHLAESDPVAFAMDRQQDLDSLEILFRPVFVRLEQEMAASVQVAQATG